MAKEQLPAASVTTLFLTQATRTLTPGTGAAVSRIQHAKAHGGAVGFGGGGGGRADDGGGCALGRRAGARGDEKRRSQDGRAG